MDLYRKMNRLKTLCTVFIVLLLSNGFPALAAQDYWPSLNNGHLVLHKYFTLSYSEEHEQAEWVYYSLVPSMLQGTVQRTNNFRQDPHVKMASAHPSDYKHSGYDRGHLVPAADCRFSRDAMSESFFMSNVSPQHPSLNRGLWKQLENWVRRWAQEKAKLYIVTGAIFRDPIAKIGANQVTVPSAYYKIIYSKKDQSMLGFILPNKKNEGILQSYIAKVDTIETKTQINFFSQLEDQLEESLESQIHVQNWSFPKK